MKEIVIERFLINEVKALGGRALKLVILNSPGFPDRTVLFPGGVVAFFELKAPGKKPTLLQESVLRKLRALGFPAFVCDSKETVRLRLRELEESHGIQPL